jgi:hypothetical protein
LRSDKIVFDYALEIVLPSDWLYVGRLSTRDRTYQENFVGLPRNVPGSLYVG